MRWHLVLCACLVLSLPAQNVNATVAASCLASEIQPIFPPLDTAPLVQVVRAADAPAPTGANCFEAQSKGGLWITVASVRHSELTQSAMVERFGAISLLQKVNYWSTIDNDWRRMVSAAFAVNAKNDNNPHPDYTVAELESGVSQYYRVADTRSDHAVTYTVSLRRPTLQSLMIETTNIEPIKKWSMTLYDADGLHTLYVLREISPGLWSYYSITRIVPHSVLARGHDSSYINRAVALYRHYMGLPYESDPPPAR